MSKSIADIMKEKERERDLSIADIMKENTMKEKERGLRTWVVTAPDDGGHWFKERYAAHQLKIQSEGGGPACLVFYTDGRISAAVHDWFKVELGRAL